MAARHSLIVDTPGPGLVEITGEVADWVAGHGGDGLLTVFIRHTSASLLIQENADPDVRADLEAFFRRLAPHADRPGMDWITHRTEGPDDMPAHIKASVLPVSLSVPVIEGRLRLGRWQGLYVCEHRDRPHRREILLTLS
jgi:secondary thiamine-phosphate synthase enzyme